MSTDSRRSAQHSGLVLAAMTLANAMVLVDQTAVPLALPEIMRHYDVGSQMVQWVLNGSLVTLAALLVLGGQLGDLLGRRRVFIIGTVAFAAASACAAFAPTFGVLVLFRAVQGAGGALMLPTTVALVSATFTGRQRGTALGTMGGIAAVAGAAGPVIGGLLTATVGWQAVFLINVPLAAVAVAVTLTAIPSDIHQAHTAKIDVLGAVLLAVGITALIVGLSQSQNWGWDSFAVWGILMAAVAAAVAFIAVERRRDQPLVDLGLFGRSPNYRTAVISQGVSGAAELGLGVILPLLLILNLGMSPGLAGLALLPASLPLIAIAPLVGRWYDKAGTRPPMLTGYLLLAASGVLLAAGGFTFSYWLVLPGLMAYGGGLAVVLTVNDPVSLSDVPEAQHGQAAGVSATAEQFGGALGIALLYLVFHTTYVAQLHAIIDRGPLADLDQAQYERLRADIIAAESTGLKPKLFDPLLSPYLDAAGTAAAWGYAAAFLSVTLLGILGSVLAWRAGPVRNRRSAQSPVGPSQTD
jgi:EmrB/QacA subfamily drug resistance transporter